MGDNRLNRQPSGRGRSTRRPRTSPASPVSVEAAEAPRPARASRTPQAARGRRPRLGFTRRALAVFTVVVLLVFSFAGALRVWLMQSQQLALANAQIEQRNQQIAALEDELVRWNDPAFVSAQARSRLGWVMPGEVGYRVIGADGSMLSGTEGIDGVGGAHVSGLEERWWDRVAASMKEADRVDGPAR
ncbi:MAG: septum formation initiator family protein [Propioniciclava sp.]|uniref:FtsB family cell division protein n=1 Tax=Propioniciclava sp. TaxID=2038686 RepID=UPI0039E2B577